MKNKIMNVILHHIKDDDKPTWKNKTILDFYVNIFPCKFCIVTSNDMPPTSYTAHAVFF
jgi:hypothetical protein